MFKKREVKANFIEDFIAHFDSHVNERMILMKNFGLLKNHYQILTVFKFAGVPFESVDDDLLIKQFYRMNQFFVDLGKDHDNNLKLWLTFIRQRIHFDEHYEFSDDFCQRFANKYIDNFTQHQFYENQFFVSFVLNIENDKNDAIEKMEKIITQVSERMKEYRPNILKSYDHDGVEYSEVYEFLNRLLTFKKTRMPITTSKAKRIIGDSNLYFGQDILKISGINYHNYAKTFELIDFGTTKIKILKDILKIDGEFVFTQMFEYKSKKEILSALIRQNNRIVAKKNKQQGFLDSQIEEIVDSQSDVETNSLLFGNYNAVISVFSKDVNLIRQQSNQIVSQFENSNGFKFTSCEIEQPNVFFSHLPGGKLFRKCYKSTINLSATFPMQNFSTGKKSLNPLGDGSAIMPLKSSSDTLYFFNIHDTPIGLDTIGKALPAQLLILGKTGSGKSALLAVILIFLNRFNPYIFSIDYGSSMEILFKVIGGTYFKFTKGENTGLNPFQLPDSLETREFLKSLMYVLTKGKKDDLSNTEKNLVNQAVNNCMDASLQFRNIRTFYNALDSKELKENLSIWIGNGSYAWVFDNKENLLNPENFDKISFDCKQILQDGYLPCEPILMTLFFLKEMMLKKIKPGQFLLTIIEEFWYPLKFTMTKNIIEDSLNTGRKSFETTILVSQHPQYAVNSDILPSIAGMNTKIFLAIQKMNTKLNEQVKKAYFEMGLSEKEFDIISEFYDIDRNFLVKQGSESVVSKLDLTEVNPVTKIKEIIPEMKVLSTTMDNIDSINELIARYGQESSQWIEEFINEN